MKLLDLLNWRYATKKYNTQKVSEEKIDQIVEIINLSASSIGIQPYRVFNIKNKEIRKQLNEVSFNSQIAESSHLLAFAAFDSIDQTAIDNFINYSAEVRGIPVESLSEFKGMIEGWLLSMPNNDVFNWATKQAYIGLGTALIGAAELKIDSTPMEGFNTEKLDELLNLKEKGLKSVVLLSLGYRDSENDYLANMKKVRLPLTKFATEII